MATRLSFRRPSWRNKPVRAFLVYPFLATFGAAISQSVSPLEQCYRDAVIYGPDAFTIIADGYSDYARAMRLKLIRELSPILMGQLTSD